MTKVFSQQLEELKNEWAFLLREGDFEKAAKVKKRIKSLMQDRKFSKSKKIIIEDDDLE